MTTDTSAKPVGIVVAMPSEARALGVTGPRNEIIRLNDNVLVYVCGVGSQNAKRATTALIKTGVGGIVSWGTAGGLVSNVDTGSVILAPTIVCKDAAYETDNAWLSRIDDRLTKSFPICRQAIYSGGQLISGAADKLRLADETGAVAVDMESGAIAELVVSAGIAMVCIRVVADPVSSTLPSILGASLDDAGFISIPRALSALARKPGETMATLQTASYFRSATNTLSDIFRTLGPRLLGP